MKFLVFLLAISAMANCQSVPPSGTADPRNGSAMSIYDWTAPLNWPNDATKFLRGDRTWAVPSGGGGSVTPNTTVPSFPFLSSLNTYSDSPLFRPDANTIEQRNGASNQCQKIYSSYTDAANNAGISFCPSVVISTITTFKNGTGSIGTLAINVTSGSVGILQTAGVNTIRWGSGVGTEFFSPIGKVNSIGTAGQFGVGTMTGNFALDGHNDATRTDIVCPAQATDTSYFIVGTFTVNTVQAGATAQTTMNWTDGGNSSSKSAVFNLDLSLATNQIDIGKPVRVLNGTTVTFTTTTAAIGVGRYNARVSCMGHM